jgi:hypothetical protein
MICPCCGQPVTPKSRLQAYAAVQPPLRRRLIETLIDATAPVPASDLADAVYADDPDGGPLSAVECVRAFVWRMRPDLQAIGYRVVSGPWSGYRLEEIAAEP